MNLSSKEEGEEDSDEAVKVLLLKDLKVLFDDDGTKALSTAFILAELEKMDDRPWSEYRKDKPITNRQMAKLLKGFRIKPKPVRPNGKRTKQVRGYRLGDCQDAFERYKS